MQNYTQCKGKKVLYIPSVFLSNERTPRVTLAGVGTIAFPANMETENIIEFIDVKIVSTPY